MLCGYAGLGKRTLLVVLCGVQGCVRLHYSLCCVGCRVGQANITRCAVWGVGLCKFTLLVVLSVYFHAMLFFTKRCDLFWNGAI